MTNSVRVILVAALLAPSASFAQQAGGSVSSDEASFLGGQPATTTEGPPAAATGETGETAGQPASDTGWLTGQDASAAAQVAVVPPPAEDPNASLREDPDQAYHLAGIRAGAAFLPSWLVEAFGLAESPGVIGPVVGVEYTFRRRGFDIVPSFWWGDYEGGGLVREDGDPMEDTEYISSTINVLWFSVDFLPGYDFNDWLSIYYGGGLGIGITLGDIVRTEAYRDAGGGWHACESEGSPDGSFCEAGGHYNYKVPRQFKGIWPVYPELNGRVGLRWKPLRNLVISAPDFSVGLPTLFFIGGRIAYMF